MKGGNIVGLLLIFAGTLVTYAGWKNIPVLSVIGVGSGGSNTANYDRTATQVAQENNFPTQTVSNMGNPQNVRTVTSNDVIYSTTPTTSAPHNVRRVGQ